MSNVTSIVIQVRDVNAGKAFYTSLFGVAPMVDSPYYVGWQIGGLNVGLDPNGHKQGLAGAIPYFEVSDIKASLQELAAKGAQVLQGARDVGGGLQIATVKDADGNIIGLSHSTK